VDDDAVAAVVSADAVGDVPRVGNKLVNPLGRSVVRTPDQTHR
jgi:hypothetical protein